MKNLMTVLMLILLALLVLPESAKADIFGEDNRRDVRIGSREYKLARSVAVGVLNSLWTPINNSISELWADPVSDLLCSDERFSRQTTVSYACTGFLVGPDLLITAGHCGVNVGEVRNSSDNYCEAYTWMFDYYANSNVRRVPSRNIYKCKEIIYAGQVGDGIGSTDFTLLRLDRKVKDRTPLKIATSKVRLGDEVHMLGHPMGLPMKHTSEGFVFDPQQNRSFLTDLDAFAGNSGSPVFNKKNEVVGVLVAGNPAQATYTDEEAGCDRYNTCDANGENCDVAVFDDGRQGFPHTFSEVQDIQFYKKLIEENL